MNALSINPEKGYIAYIVNPKSGASSHKPTGRQFRQYLIEKGFNVRLNLTNSLQHACELATDAAVDYDCSLVVAVGGDGTIREVAHGLEGSNTPLLIIPCGTENLLANELGLDERLGTIISVFEGGYARPLDLGTANGKCFTSIAGFGFDGEVVKRVSRQRKGHINHLDYFWPIFRTFWTYKFPPLTVAVDDEVIFNGRGIVFIGNISRYAVGLQLLHRADFSDGLLDICVYKCASKAHLMKHAVYTVLKLHTSGSDVIYRHGKTASVSSEMPAIATQIDGDPGPPLPVRISIIPKALNVIISEHAKPAGIRRRIIWAMR